MTRNTFSEGPERRSVRAWLCGIDLVLDSDCQVVQSLVTNLDQPVGISQGDHVGGEERFIAGESCKEVVLARGTRNTLTAIEERA